MQVIDNQLVYLVSITNPEGVRVKHYYDPKTGFKIRRVTDVPGAVPSTYGDYRGIATGIKIPYSEKTSVGGVVADFKVT
jgi:hypothetical protein